MKGGPLWFRARQKIVKPESWAHQDYTAKMVEGQESNDLLCPDHCFYLSSIHIVGVRYVCLKNESEVKNNVIRSQILTLLTRTLEPSPCL